MRTGSRLGVLAAVVAGIACSSDSATRPTVAPNIALMDRFDSLSHIAQADSDVRSELFTEIAEILAEGAPVQMATISIDGHAIRDSTVSALIVETSHGQPTDSTLQILMWDGHGPDSIIAVETIATLSDLSMQLITRDGFQVNVQPFVSGIDTVALALAAPGAACMSLLTERPPDLDPPPPTACQAQRIAMSFTLPPQFGSSDTVSMSQQTLQSIRLQF
jgi:hypothetical protein